MFGAIGQPLEDRIDYPFIDFGGESILLRHPDNFRCRDAATSLVVEAEQYLIMFSWGVCLFYRDKWLERKME